MNQAQQRTIYLTPENLIRYLTADDEIDTLVNCKNTEIDILTYDFDLYEALGSLNPNDEIKMHRLIKLLECVDVLPYRKTTGRAKPVLTNYRVEQLRNNAR